MDDELIHYGIPGMHWGKKKSTRISDKINRIDKRNTKLNNKADQLNSKYMKVAKSNEEKKKYLNAKLTANKLFGSSSKKQQIMMKVMELDAKTMTAKYKVDEVKNRIAKNEKLQARLKVKMDNAIKKENTNN